MPWSVSGTTARLQTDSLAAQLDLRHPNRGLVAVQTRFHRGLWDEVRGDGLLRVHAAGRSDEPHEVIDSYVRGTDLVAAYAPVATGDVQFQIYWRSLGSTLGRPVGLEVIVSVQTGLLDSDPGSVVSSLVSAEAVSGLGTLDQSALPDLGDVTTVDCGGAGGLVLFRLTPGHLSYVEMIHPTDFCSSHVVATRGLVRSTFRLFEERLEKGVIRRGRLRGFFLPREGDGATALELFSQFAATPPPLTA